MSKKRCAVEKVIGILRYFHLDGLAEVKECLLIRRCSIWCVSVSFCGFLFFWFFFRISEIQPRSAIKDIQKHMNTFIVGFTVIFRLIVCLFFLFFFLRVTPGCALTFVVYVIHFLRETDDVDRKIMQSSNVRRWAKFQHVVLLPGFIQQQLRLIPFMEKKLVKMHS